MFHAYTMSMWFMTETHHRSITYYDKLIIWELLLWEMWAEFALQSQYIWTGKCMMDMSNSIKKNNFIVIINTSCKCYTMQFCKKFLQAWKKFITAYMEYNTQTQPLQHTIYKEGNRNAETLMQ